jgi:spore coat protein U-like protein
VSGTGTGGDQIVIVYGLVPASQNVGAGGYVDTITATITF